MLTIGELKFGEFSRDFSPADIDALADTLFACVEQGASVGFILPFSKQQAQVFWHKLLPAFASGEKRLLVARLHGKIVGTVQLVVGAPANGKHRAEVSKLLVHPEARRQGIAKQLMQRIETLALIEEKSLLVLDTDTHGSAVALYEGLGYQLAGVIPDYALSVGGELHATSVMYKKLTA
ncbi:GNAT family N-acetyltransferase [Rouxiella sp. Mn2063]|uniref:GNAT family N-acetyltransferase n=1 Tax=Rouxiella sp. Mn2063 TaxID=3395262 RepID=UPI003BDA1724